MPSVCVCIYIILVSLDFKWTSISYQVFLFKGKEFAATLYAAITTYKIRWQRKRSDIKSWVKLVVANHLPINVC